MATEATQPKKASTFSKKGGRPAVYPKAKKATRFLARRGYSLKEILVGLRVLHKEGKIEGVPHPRQVQRWVKDAKAKDSTPPWTLTAETARDAALVLPVMAEVLECTEGRVALTRDLAEWVAWVRRAAPDLPLWCAYETAIAYQQRATIDKDTGDLDAFLAFASWRGLKAWRRFERWVRHYRPEWVDERREHVEVLEDGHHYLFTVPDAGVDGMQIALDIALEQLDSSTAAEREELGKEPTRIPGDLRYPEVVKGGHNEQASE